MAALHINNGSILENHKGAIISFEWLNVLFWRTFLCLVLHYSALLIICSLSMKLGWVSKIEVDSQNEDVVVRPSEDTATMFAFVKQAFYHKTLAYTNLERKRDRERSAALPCFNEPKKKAGTIEIV